MHVDILERTGSGWTIVEVKAAVGVKEHYLTAAAVKAHVLRNSGVEVERIEIMHLNRNSLHPGLKDLFTRKDVSEQVWLLESKLEGIAEAQTEMLRAAIPQTAVGDHCSFPFHAPSGIAAGRLSRLITSGSSEE